MTDTLTTAVDLTATSPARRWDRFGVHVCGDGVDAVVHAPTADAVWVCLFDGEGEYLSERRVALLPRLHGVWHGHIDGVEPGQRYGLRVDGPWDRAHGLCHNPAKVLLDPYARGIAGSVRLAPEIYAHQVDDNLAPLPVAEPDPRDSAAFVALGVVLEDHPGGGVHTRPMTTWSQTVIYEAHVRGLTMNLESVPEHLRGTYAGVAHPATIAHLRGMGVTTIELLPIHAKFTEPALQQRGAVNYWGYNSLNYFAPEPSYATTAAQQAGAAAVLDEVKGMVQLLHEAGLEVVLDVVYNHTCEGGPDGPSLSWRGLDNHGYYLHDGAGHYRDVTGCGNSLDFRNPRVVQLTLDSLRYWVERVGVDGFRFDLMTTLARHGDEVDMSHPLLVALATDPVLRSVKLIAEPWDVGPHGWQTGHFPAPVSEWNDKYRDTVRSFWLSDAAAIDGGGTGSDLRDLATRMAGSADMFAHTDVPGGRGPVASINFVTAHDGFTLADLTAYNSKHNEPNGEHNRDGSENNRSWNHGVEGLTDDAEVLAARRRTMRNLLGTLLLSDGVPMITAGDEIARTQHGNNNAYCRDDDNVWVDWNIDDHQRDLYATVAALTALRKQHVVLRPWRFRRPDEARSGVPTLIWYDATGQVMSVEDWHDTAARVVQKYRMSPEPDGRDALVVINGSAVPAPVHLPDVGGLELMWDSALERPEPSPGDGDIVMPPWTMRLYLSR